MIKNSNATALVDTQGAKITRFQLGTRDILFPTHVAETSEGLRERGGTFICYPYWGNRGMNAPRHGYLRDFALPKVYQQGIAVIWANGLIKGSDHLAGDPYTSFVSVKSLVKPNGLEQEILIRNLSSDPMPINPGWHPYFMMPQSTALVSSGPDQAIIGATPGTQVAKKLKASGGVVTVFLPGLGNLTVHYPSDFKSVVVWTDNPKYLCVEPVADTGSESALMLKPYKEVTFKFSLEVVLDTL